MNKSQFQHVSIVPRHPEVQRTPKKSPYPSTKQSQHNEVWPTTYPSNIDLMPIPNDPTPESSHPQNLKSSPTTPKQSTTKVLVIVSVIVLAICSLAALGIGIYFLVRDANTTIATTSTTTMGPKGWRWSTIGATVAGTGGPSVIAGYLHTPYHVTLDSSDAMYIADCTNHRIQRHVFGSSIGTTVAGQANGVGGSTAYDLITPTFVLVDVHGNLYVSDAGNHRIQFFQNGNLSGTTVAGTGAAGSALNQLNSPRGLALDSSTDTLYIADMTNHRIVRYLSGAAVGTRVAGGLTAGTSNTLLHTPMGLYLDVATNSLYISNNAANNIVRWVIGASTWTLVAGNPSGLPGTTSTSLSGPMYLSVDYVGNMYVADALNQRIQFFLANQTNATTIAGATNRFGNMANLLYNPYAVAFDTDMNLYVADASNQRIQRFQRE